MKNTLENELNEDLKIKVNVVVYIGLSLSAYSFLFPTIISFFH